MTIADAIHVRASRRTYLPRPISPQQQTQLGKTDKFYADLDAIVKANNGLWCLEAEKYVLANAKEI